MKVLLASALGDEATSTIRSEVTRAGHTVVVDTDLPELSDCDAAVVVVSTTPDAERLVAAWETVEAARAELLPVIGASLNPPQELGAAVAAMPRDGSWIEVGGDAPGIRPLLAVLDAVDGAVDPGAADGLEEVTGELVTDSDDTTEHDAARDDSEQRGSRFARSARRVRERADAFDASSLSNSLRQAGRRVAESLKSEDENEPSTPTATVFVSYSRRDKLAEDVCEELRQHGYAVWVDTTSIPGGADWRVSISRGIKAADVFVLLISPNVVRHTKYVSTELGLAQSTGKPIIPVQLKRTPTMPEGLDLVLSSLHYIDLSVNYSDGMKQLLEVLGGERDTLRRGTLRTRAVDASRFARRVTRERELGSKVKKYGGAAVSGGVLVAIGMTKLIAEQQEEHRQAVGEQQAQHRQEARDQRSRTLDRYLEQTVAMLARAMEEIQLTSGMSPREYRDEFRPKFMRILGQLEGTQLEDQAIQARHSRLVDELDRLVDEFDSAMDKADRGDLSGYERAIERLNAAWAGIITSALDWLRDAAAASADVSQA